MSEYRIGRWRKHQTQKGCKHAHQGALRKNKRIDSCLTPQAISMTTWERHWSKAAYHQVKLFFGDYDTLLHAGLIHAGEPGRYYHEARIAVIISELDAQQCNQIVDELLYTAAFLDYLETRTVIGARRNRERANLGFISWLEYVAWELCSSSRRNPLKEQQTWDVCLRYIKTRLKSSGKVQKLPRMLRSLRLYMRRRRA